MRINCVPNNVLFRKDWIGKVERCVLNVQLFKFGLNGLG